MNDNNEYKFSGQKPTVYRSRSGGLLSACANVREGDFPTLC